MHPKDLQELLVSISLAVKDDYLSQTRETKYKLPEEVLVNDNALNAIQKHFSNHNYDVDVDVEDGRLLLKHPTPEND